MSKLYTKYFYPILIYTGKTLEGWFIMSDDVINQVCDGLDMLNEDNSIPRNIRRGAEEIKSVLLNESDPLDVRVSTATSRLDELANDPNIPLHGRTLIWNIMSRLEELA